MKLENEFRVDVPVEEAWRVLLDVERIAPCMPGAQLQEVEGDEYRGIVTVKVGPITAQSKGVARITESDDANHRAVIRAEGRDTRGQGNASATATAVLQPDGDGTRVNIDSDVTITGKVAQFGRGVIADVSAKVLDQFVACLESDVLSSAGDRPAASEVAKGGKARTIEAPEAEPVDLLRTAGAPVLKRVVPVAAAVVVVVVVVLILLLR
jgi:carbon monoxide dehydrogenase subunit G